MNRRECLVAIGGITTFAGCSELTGDSDDQTLDPTSGNDTETSGDEDGEQSETSESGAASGSGSGGDPTDTVVAYFQAINQGNLDRIAEISHPDSSAAQEELENLEQEGLEMFEQAAIIVQETTVVSQDQGRAVVEARVTTTFGGEEQTQTSRLELRPDDGTWKIWGEAGETGDAGGDQEQDQEQKQDDEQPVAGGAPADTVVAYYRAINNGDFERAAEALHPDSAEAQEELDIGEQDRELAEQIQIRVEEATVVSQDQDRAVVETTVTTVFGGEEQTQTSRLELRPDDGTWKIWGEAGETG